MSERHTNVPTGRGSGATLEERKRIARDAGDQGDDERKTFAEMLRETFGKIAEDRERRRPEWMQRKVHQLRESVAYGEHDGLVAQLLPPPDRHSGRAHRQLWVVRLGPTGMPLAQHPRRDVALRMARTRARIAGVTA